MTHGMTPERPPRRCPRRVATLALAGWLPLAAACGDDGAGPGPGDGLSALDLVAGGPFDLARAGDAPPTTDDLGPLDPMALFPAGSPWYTPVGNAPLDAESAPVIAALQAAGGWGAGDRFQIDFSLFVLDADANTPTRTFTRNDSFWEPDCDYAPMPIPAVGATEGEVDYHCASDGDCHLLVVDRPHGKLFELYRADVVSANEFNGGCLALWDMTRVYPANGRGDGCTSADAAGFPMAPLTPNADEVYRAVQTKGSLGHALRFILPNERIRRHTYVHPATHTTDATSGGPLLPPYGARLRLRPDYPVQNLPTEAARVIARTLIKYGMLLSDGGNIALTFEDDRYRQHKWGQDMSFDSHSMFGIQVTDFQMVDGGQRLMVLDCTRN